MSYKYYSDTAGGRKHSTDFYLSQAGGLKKKYDAEREQTEQTDTVKPPSYYMGGVKAFTPSAQYQQEMTYANSILNALKSGRTAYTDQLNNIMNRIQNRKSFSYDMDTDSMFQNSLQSAMTTGKAAMQDTMGQAAALTGGYGSTYATSAANQAYNAYIQDAYNNLPDYYNMALEAYNMEGQNLYNQASMLQNADESWYNRIVNAYQAQRDKVNTMYDQEYSNYWQAQNYNQNAAQFNAEMAYKQAKDKVAQNQWDAEYALSLAKVVGDGDSKTAATIADYSKEIIQAANKYGLYSGQYKQGNNGGTYMIQPESQFYQYAADLANKTGLDPKDILDYAKLYVDQSVYTLNADGRYADQWGTDLQTYDADPNDPGNIYGTGVYYTEPVFTKIEKKSDKKNDVFEDQYHNQYTRAQIETMYGGKFKDLISGM